MNPVFRNEPGSVQTALVVTGLLLIFAALSFTAELGKSAIFDEPLHAVGAMVHRDLHDFRINPEDPPLLGWWAALPQPHGALKLDKTDPDYSGALHENLKEWRFAVNTLYRTDGAAAADLFLNRSRVMFLALGILLGAMVARWAYEVGGSYAAIVACGFFSFEPNLLGHSVLIKSDVPIAFFVLCLAYFTWHAGLDGRWKWLAGAIAAAALAPNMKLTGVLCGPVLIAMLLFRAMFSEPWKMGRNVNARPARRLAMICCVVLLVVVASWFTIYAVYGFRYSGTVDGTPLNTGDTVRMDDEKASTLPVQLDLWMQDHHVMPEGWLFAILMQFMMTSQRANYLMGATTSSGMISYFPLAFLFKTPTATLLAIVSIPFAAKWLKPTVTANNRFSHRWLMVCLILPPFIFAGIAMMSGVNIGLRHIILIYPFIFVALGIGAATVIRNRPTAGAILIAALLLGTAAEAVAAYPNYVAFFNFPSGGTSGGIALLGDSNLDWGQDLPALAKWSREHPDRKIYFSYFGTANPAAYGIQCVTLLGGWMFTDHTNRLDQPGVIAISATNLQGMYLSQTTIWYYKTLLHNQKPFESLNGTIYLYDWPPRK